LKQIGTKNVLDWRRNKLLLAKYFQPQFCISPGRVKLQDWTLTDQQKCKGGHCRTGHCRTGLAGVDNDGRPTDWRSLACYRCCGSVL